MRNAFANSVLNHCNKENFFFLTGDLGFMALEQIQTAFKDRFINCGIAEQNMVSIAAGLAKEGMKCFVYSIAPFVYARPYEQIRNDICFSNLPVCLVGNGGGYGYGHMGPTHHALEDCAAMHALGVRVVVPCFNSDVGSIVQDIDSPTYLRLGYDTSPAEFDVPNWEDWRCVLQGGNGIWVTLGPLTGLAIKTLKSIPEDERPSLWACGAFTPPPDELVYAVLGQKLTVFEEHVAEGGLGMFLLYWIMTKNVALKEFVHRHALRYPSKRFGSQTFHRKECSLDEQSMRQLVR